MNLFQRRSSDTDAPVRTALVVDDSRSARYAMRKLLEQHGYTVDTAESAQDAYVYLQRRQPGVIFLDHQMPGHDGLDMLRELRQGEETRNVPVVICSADEDDAFRRRARSAGAAGVLAKPPHADRMTALLRELEGPPTPNATTRRRREPQISAPDTRRSPDEPTRTAPPAAPAQDARIDSLQREVVALQQEVAALRKELAARPIVNTATLLPALQDVLAPWIRELSTAAVRHALAEHAQRLADELRSAGKGTPSD